MAIGTPNENKIQGPLLVVRSGCRNCVSRKLGYLSFCPSLPWNPVSHFLSKYVRWLEHHRVWCCKYFPFFLDNFSLKCWLIKGVFTYLIDSLGVKDVQFEELVALDADHLRQQRYILCLESISLINAKSFFWEVLFMELYFFSSIR